MFYLHFADEESKAQRNELPQVHIATEEKSLGLNLGIQL